MGGGYQKPSHRMSSVPDPDEPDQEALFELEGPDEDSCVWIVIGKGENALVANLGPREGVATKLADWLASIDFGERP